MTFFVKKILQHLVLGSITDDWSHDAGAVGQERVAGNAGLAQTGCVAPGSTENRHVLAGVVGIEVLPVSANDDVLHTDSVEGDGAGVDLAGEAVAGEDVEGETGVGHWEARSELEVLSVGTGIVVGARSVDEGVAEETSSTELLSCIEISAGESSIILSGHDAGLEVAVEVGVVAAEGAFVLIGVKSNLNGADICSWVGDNKNIVANRKVVDSSSSLHFIE